MQIGQEIKQESFESNFSKAIINILYTASALQTSLSEVFKTKSIQSQHFNVLRIIKGAHPKPVSPGYIKEVMLDKGRDLTRLLDKLESKGYISRKPNKENRRMINIHMTDMGLNELNDLNKSLKKWYDCKADIISEEEAEILSNLLDRLRG